MRFSLKDSSKNLAFSPSLSAFSTPNANNNHGNNESFAIINKMITIGT